MGVGGSMSGRAATVLRCVVALLVATLACAHTIPVLVDTDMGYDDVSALSLLLGSFSCAEGADNAFQVVHVTTVFGEHSVQNCTRLALGMLQSVGSIEDVERCGRNPSTTANFPHVPVSAGSAIYLVTGNEMPFEDAEVELPAFPSEVLLRPTEMTAVEALVFEAGRHDGNLVVVALGPLTNIAKALEYEEFVAGLDRIIIMGG